MSNKVKILPEQEFKKLVQSIIKEEKDKLANAKKSNSNIDSILENFSEDEIRQVIKEVIKESDDKATLTQKSYKAMTGTVSKPKMGKELGTSDHSGNSAKNGKWMVGNPSKKDVKVTTKAEKLDNDSVTEDTPKASDSGVKFYSAKPAKKGKGFNSAKM